MSKTPSMTSQQSVQSKISQTSKQSVQRRPSVQSKKSVQSGKANFSVHQSGDGEEEVDEEGLSEHDREQLRKKKERDATLAERESENIDREKAKQEYAELKERLISEREIRRSQIQEKLDDRADRLSKCVERPRVVNPYDMKEDFEAYEEFKNAQDEELARAYENLGRSLGKM